MSAEEFEKPNRIPKGLEKALEQLAKKTVENGWDAGRVAMMLYRFLHAWNDLTPKQREAVRQELHRRRRKPRHRGQQR